jgi:hypothetical protein
VFGGAAILRSLIERSEMGTIGLGVYVGSWLYMVVLISLLFFYPVAMVVGIVVVGLISCGLAIFAALAMLVGVTLNAMVPASRLRWLPLLCVVCLAIGAAAFVSALASGVSAVRSEIAQSVPPSARAAPAADSSMAGDPPADTQTSDRAAAKPSDGARTALAWAQVSLEGASIAVFAAYLLAALYLRGLAKFIGDESTASEATPFLAVSTILGVIAVISAVLTRSEALSHGLANFLLLVVLASSVPASVWFFRLIRSAHDLVAMATQ